MYKITKLDNGLRVATHDMKDRDSVALGFMIGVGGRFESDDIKGVSHFMEHIAFKGSKKYKCEQIKELIEGVGGTLNAYTSEEQTCFYAKIPAKHLDRTFDVLADMVISPKISQKDVEKEKTVIIEEIKMYKDIPQYLAQELMHELLWPNHPLGGSLAGTPEVVSTLSSRSLRALHTKYYCPENIVITVSGNCKHNKIIALAKKKFSMKASNHRSLFEKADNVQKKPRLNLYKKDIEQMHIAFGVLGYSKDHKDKYALSILSTILGGNMSSRLFSEIREKRGLAYSISCSTVGLSDTGVFLIRAGVENTKVVEALRVILAQLEKIKKNGVNKDEFTRGKDYILGQLLLGLEDTMDHMLWIGDSVLTRNKVRTAASIVKAFNKVKMSDIRRVAKDILTKSRYNLAVVGPLTGKQDREIRNLLVK